MRMQTPNSVRDPFRNCHIRLSMVSQTMKPNQLNRRVFLGSSAAMLAATQAAAFAEESTADSSAGESTEKGYELVVPGYYGSRPGIQLGTQLPATAER